MVGPPAQQHVGGLDVPVHQVGRVDVGQTVCDLLHQSIATGTDGAPYEFSIERRSPSGTSWVAIQSRPSSSPCA